MPIMTIATSADQISQEELKQIGVHIHFIKPIDISVFREEVDEVLQQQDRMVEEAERAEEEEEAEEEKEADDEE